MGIFQSVHVAIYDSKTFKRLARELNPNGTFLMNINTKFQCISNVKKLVKIQFEGGQLVSQASSTLNHLTRVDPYARAC